MPKHDHMNQYDQELLKKVAKKRLEMMKVRRTDLHKLSEQLQQASKEILKMEEQAQEELQEASQDQFKRQVQLGDTVLFKTEDGELRAAIVIKVWSQDVVNLWALYVPTLDNGQHPQEETSVPRHEAPRTLMNTFSWNFR